MIAFLRNGTGCLLKCCRGQLVKPKKRVDFFPNSLDVQISAVRVLSVSIIRSVAYRYYLEEKPYIVFFHCNMLAYARNGFKRLCAMRNHFSA